MPAPAIGPGTTVEVRFPVTATVRPGVMSISLTMRLKKEPVGRKLKVLIVLSKSTVRLPLSVAATAPIRLATIRVLATVGAVKLTSRLKLLPRIEEQRPGAVLRRLVNSMRKEETTND